MIFPALLFFAVAVFSGWFLLDARERGPENNTSETATVYPAFQPGKGYADSGNCVDCHEDVCRQWSQSDHARSMDHATEQSVLGDFQDASFLHIGMDDLPLLADGDIRTWLDRLERSVPELDPRREYDVERKPLQRYNIKGRKIKETPVPRFDDLALAVIGTKEDVAETLLRNMSEDRRRRFIEQRDYLRELRIHRPGDIAAAQDRVLGMLRRLVEEGTVETSIGTRFRMYRSEENGKNRFMVETDLGPFEVLYTLGIRPLQQYLVSLDNGRVQTLPLAWDSVDRRWFHLYPQEQIRRGDPLHWTASLQNWNRMCADCHTTNLHRNFDPETTAYKTTFAEINVGCQSCHGPCEKHDRIGREHGFETTWSKDVPLDVYRLTEQTDRKIIDSCSFCHARRRLIREGPKPPEVRSEDWFVPERIDVPTYFEDGQLLEEAFEYGSFRQSKMYGKGVGCVNCHDPHTSELRFKGNRLCTQCHAPSIYDTVKHHFHSDSEKPGTQCVECHFPQSTYMVVDPRRDHSIRKPSPALTQATGVPNACSLCHQDRTKGETLSWAGEWVELWYAEKRKSEVGYREIVPVEKHYARAIGEGRAGNVDAADPLLALVRDREEQEFRAPVRAGALSLLGRLMQRPSATDAVLRMVLEGCRAGTQDPDPLVRFAAAESLAFLPETERLDLALKLLEDPVRSVRIEAARVLAPSVHRLPKEKQSVFEKAKEEFVLAQRVDSDQAASYLNLAVLEQDLQMHRLEEVNRWYAATARSLPPGDPGLEEAGQTALSLVRRLTESALALYRNALRLDPDFLPIRINLAMLHHQRGEMEDAEKQFREALRIDPKNGQTVYSLGLFYAELGRLPEATERLAEASRLLESEPSQSATRNRVRYNLGLLLLQMNRPTEAEKELTSIVQAEPENSAFLHALTTFYLQRGEKSKAAPLAERLIRLQPENPLWRQLRNAAR